MNKAVLPKNIKPAYICETCGENWYANEKGNPWEKHSLKRMRKKGLELKIGEVFDYNGDRKEQALDSSDIYFGIIIASEPIYSNYEHRRQYGIIEFTYDDGLYRLNRLLDYRYDSYNFYDGAVREYNEQEFEKVTKMLKKNPEFQGYKKRNFKGKPIIRGVLKKK